MRWEAKEKENGKWGIYLCEEFWRYPDKPVCYGEASDERIARQSAERLNKSEEELEAEEPKEESE
jgi:hypothetical protein